MTKEEAKHLSEVLKAYSEGKTIQAKGKLHYTLNEWHDLTSDLMTFDISKFDYRIKPKLRPYANAEEFLKAYKEHGPYYIQIDLKNDQFYMKPNCVINGGFYTYNDIICIYSEFLQMFEWQDGTPCGILEE